MISTTFLSGGFCLLVSQSTVNLCTTVTLGKWQGDYYTQGDRFIQINFAENIRQLKISGSCPVTVINRVIAIYGAVIYRFDCNLITIWQPIFIWLKLVLLYKFSDLRPVLPSVDRRSAPDALLSEIFNDPSATSLTKLTPEDSDSDIDDISGSGSELWSSGSDDLPQPSKDSSTPSETVTPITSQQTSPSTQTETTASLSTENSDTNDNDNSKDNTVTSSSDSTANSIDTNTTYSANSPIDSTIAQNAPQQSSTNSSSTSSPVTSQGADVNLPSSEEQSQNSVVQTEENDKSFNDTSAPNADIFPVQTPNSLETVADNPEASLVSQLATQAGFDDSSLYDPTIVKKTNVPDALYALSTPVGTFDNTFLKEIVVVNMDMIQWIRGTSHSTSMFCFFVFWGREESNNHLLNRRVSQY